MAVTSGFFNSLNNDRVYDSEEFGSIFDGVIRDGIYRSYGAAFNLTQKGPTLLELGTGRGWFNKTWILNDSVLSLQSPPTDNADRIDYVAILIDRRDQTRAGTIQYLTGPQGGTPPSLVTGDAKYKIYPMWEIRRLANEPGVDPKNIKDLRGTDYCPYSVAIFGQFSATQVFDKFEQDFNSWFVSQQHAMTKSVNDVRASADQFESELSSRTDAALVNFNQKLKDAVELSDDTIEGSELAKMRLELAELRQKLGANTNEGVLYGDIRDSRGETIVDSYNTPLVGKTIIRKG